jgi:hypothetical protein
MLVEQAHGREGMHRTGLSGQGADV